MHRGDIFWFEPDPVRGSEQSGRRPCLIVSRDAINRSSDVIVAVPISTFRGRPLYPSDVLISSPGTGLAQDSIALGLQVRAIDKQRLGARIGRTDEVTMRQVEDALLQVLDIDR